MEAAVDIRIRTHGIIDRICGGVEEKEITLEPKTKFPPFFFPEAFTKLRTGSENARDESPTPLYGLKRKWNLARAMAK
jgi:hypothetical protein